MPHQPNSAATPLPWTGEPTPLVVGCADGYALQGKSFDADPRRRRNATVIVCPAFFVRQRYYWRFARHLAEQGLHAITFANRGMGVSLAAEKRRWRHRLRDWGELDLPAVIAHVKDRQPDHQLFVVGHSMGGQLVGLSEAVHQLDGIVTVAATAAYWAHFSFPVRLGILSWYRLAKALATVVPTFPASRLGLGPTMSADLVGDWVTWGSHRDYLNGPFGLDLQMRAYRGRVLAYSFADDLFGSQRAIESLHRDYTQAELSYRHVHPQDVGAVSLGHFGFFRSRTGPPLWQRTIDWMGIG